MSAFLSELAGFKLKKIPERREIKKAPAAEIQHVLRAFSSLSSRCFVADYSHRTSVQAQVRQGARNARTSLARWPSRSRLVHSSAVDLASSNLASCSSC